VQRLEKIRFAGAVLAHCQHEAGSKLQLERLVGPVVTERDFLDDQSA
jgi:hypothetical protein